jgi:hypothetical protein
MLLPFVLAFGIYAFVYALAFAACYLDSRSHRAMESDHVPSPIAYTIPNSVELVSVNTSGHGESLAYLPWKTLPH